MQKESAKYEIVTRDDKVGNGLPNSTGFLFHDN